MTVEIDEAEVNKIIYMLKDGKEEWANAMKVFAALSNLYHCSPQTPRNFVYRHPELYEVKYGKVRVKVAQIKTNVDQDSATAEFEQWLAPRLVLAEECAQQLNSAPQNPDVETLLIALANAREDLNSYDDTKLQSVVMELRKIYGFKPNTIIGEE